jgi:hypothetical protein
MVTAHPCPLTLNALHLTPASKQSMKHVFAVADSNTVECMKAVRLDNGFNTDPSGTIYMLSLLTEVKSYLCDTHGRYRYKHATDKRLVRLMEIVDELYGNTHSLQEDWGPKNNSKCPSSPLMTAVPTVAQLFLPPQVLHAFRGIVVGLKAHVTLVRTWYSVLDFALCKGIIPCTSGM